MVPCCIVQQCIMDESEYSGIYKFVRKLRRHFVPKNVCVLVEGYGDILFVKMSRLWLD